MTDLNQFIAKEWSCTDLRFPTNENIQRTPPEKAFLNSVAVFGILAPIMMGHNDVDGWFLVFGRKRLLAVRQLLEEESGNGMIWVREAYDLDREEARYLSMIENAQRTKNPLSDYADIREILRSDRNATYKSIAQQIGVTKTYVETVDKTYGNVPDWALKAALDDKVADSVLVALSKAPTEHQKLAKEYFTQNKNLPMSILQGFKRAQKMEFSQSFSMSVPAIPRMLIPRDEIEELLAIANDGSIAEGNHLGILRNKLQTILEVMA